MTLAETKTFARWLLLRGFFLMVAAYCLSTIALKLGFKDDTDTAKARSGLGLYTDAATGCQYLSAGGNGITPRLNEDGTHRGCRND